VKADIAGPYRDPRGRLPWAVTVTLGSVIETYRFATRDDAAAFCRAQRKRRGGGRGKSRA
jgi:hypothetical protein